ncbi:MAG: 6-phosphofructokinase, partial [Clostridia bacterium]|nr:6-phosphofructokinase [Clostridia bacterium]
YAIYSGMTVYGIERGYTGLINNNIREMNKRSVSDIIQRGGTILKTARCPEFVEDKYMQMAVDNMEAYGIDGLVVIGGDGSFRGALDLYKKFGVKAIGIPGTIDNDLAYTDYTLGFDTSVNTVVSAINNLRDTMTSHDRVCIIEVMGRKCGDIALYAGICGGAEIILVPEVPFDLKQIVKKINLNQRIGKSSDIIVLAEGVCKAEDLKKQLQANGIAGSIKTTTLGYIQRGGAPTMADRVLSARCAVRAVDLLIANQGGRVVGIKDNKIIDEDIEEALKKKGKFDDNLYQTAMILGL